MIIQGFMLVFLICIFISVYAVVTAKGYGSFLGLVAVVISALITPFVVLLLCLFLLPTKKGSEWDK